MRVVVSIDGQVCGDDELVQRVEGVIEGSLERFGEQIVRVTVDLGDRESLTRGDRDKSCKLEALVQGLRPLVASHEAATLTEAIHASADKLRRALVREIRETGAVPGYGGSAVKSQDLFSPSGAGGRAGGATGG